MALSKRAVAEFLARLAAKAESPDATPDDRRELRDFKKRVKKTPYLSRLVNEVSDKEKFERNFRTTGCVNKKILRDQYAASGLPFDDWVTQRRATQKIELEQRLRVQVLFGNNSVRISASGAVSILVGRVWTPAGTLRTLFPSRPTPSTTHHA